MITRRSVVTAAAALLGSRPAWSAEPAPLPPQAPGDGAQPPLTDAGLEALRRRNGAAAAQRRGGRTRTWATGVRMTGAEAAVTPNDQWHLGSISKSFLATLVARLADQRRLAWDDRLGEALAAEHRAIPTPYRDATF